MGFLNSMFGSSEPKGTNETGLDWNNLDELPQLDEIFKLSQDTPIIIFKHSSRCAISRMALKNFENEYKLSGDAAKIYFLDILNHRDISAAIAERFGVWHESPQLLLIYKGKAVYNSSHSDISAEEVSGVVRGE